MKTKVTVNDLSELKAVAGFNGETVNTAELEISFPYAYEVEVPEGEKEELSFEDFKETIQNWIETSKQLPPNGHVVATKIHDEKGERNVQHLKRVGNLWYTSDGKIYVYYTPTHWR